MLLTGISMEKQFTQSLVAISPEGTSGASVARSYRGARWLVGGAPFAGFLAAFVIVQVLNSSPNHRVHAFGWLGLAVLPLGVLAAVRAAYASAHLKAPPLAVRLLVYVLLFLLEAAISFATFGLFGIGAAIVGLVVFAGRAFTPPKTPLGPHRWSPPET